MTSNIGSEYILSNKKGYENDVEKVLRNTFKPEFLNRIDEIIYFNKLDNKVIEKIYDKFIGLLDKRLANANKKLVVSEVAKNKIIEEGYSEDFGARPLKRYIQKNIESLIAKDLLINPNKEVISIDFVNDEYVIR